MYLPNNFLTQHLSTLIADLSIYPSSWRVAVAFDHSGVLVIAGAELADRGEAWAVVGFGDVAVLAISLVGFDSAQPDRRVRMLHRIRCLGVAEVFL